MGRLLAVLIIGVFSCGGEVGATGDGPEGGNGGDAVDSGPRVEKCGALTAVIRDFKDTHPDMQRAIASVRGLVKPELDGDGLPAYAPSGSTEVTEGADAFAQWYRDVPDVNMRFEVDLALSEVAAGQFVFEDSEFFPIDGQGFDGQERLGHNFHFTTELRGTFRYRGGEVFTFEGDDDVFVFVNGRLALDLGGVHGVETDTIDFDSAAAELGIEIGGLYALDVFHAERHTEHSRFRIETSIDCLHVVE